VFPQDIWPISNKNCNGGRNCGISSSCIEDWGPNSCGLHHL